MASTKKGFSFANVVRHQMFIPVLAILLLSAFNLITDPSFFSITVGYNSAGDPILQGYLITILNFGSELAILAIGMTLVTAASGGQDISVGSAIAIAGSIMLRLLTGASGKEPELQMPIICAFLIALVVALLFGAFNGVLVAVFKIQPMVATLILYTAGRSIAAWVNNNKLPVVTDKSFAVFGGNIAGIPIPVPVFIAVICIVVMMLVLRFTTLGLYVQSVGINQKAAKLNGINPVAVKILTYVILGACVAIAALIKTSRMCTINYSTIAKDIEMDAILAVALGGNNLSGGKFNMMSSILGAYIIEFLTITLYRCDVSSDAISAYKAVVVIILVIFSAPVVREKIDAVARRKTSKNTAKEVA